MLARKEKKRFAVTYKGQTFWTWAYSQKQAQFFARFRKFKKAAVA